MLGNLLERLVKQSIVLLVEQVLEDLLVGLQVDLGVQDFVDWAVGLLLAGVLLHAQDLGFRIGM